MNRKLVLLANPDYMIATVTAMVEYANAGKFAAFQACHGCTTLEYQKSMMTNPPLLFLLDRIAAIL